MIGLCQSRLALSCTLQILNRFGVGHTHTLTETHGTITLRVWSFQILLDLSTLIIFRSFRKRKKIRKVLVLSRMKQVCLRIQWHPAVQMFPIKPHQNMTNRNQWKLHQGWKKRRYSSVGREPHARPWSAMRTLWRSLLDVEVTMMSRL